MCLELPGRVIEVVPDRTDIARVDVGGVVRAIHLGMLDGPPPAPGDWLTLHLGFAIGRMTDAEAAEALAFEENDPFGALLADLGDGVAVPARDLDPASTPSRT